MKNKLSVLLQLLVLIFVCTQKINAQEEITNSVSTKDFKIHSINISASYYNPSMDYFNHDLLPFLKVTDSFGTNLSYGGNLTLKLPMDFRARVGASYWKDQVEGNSNSELKHLEVELTRFKLGALYVPEKLSFSAFQLYAGVEGQYFMVKNALTMEANSPTQKGSDFSVAPLAGVEFSVGRLVAAVEYSYNLGKYKQAISDIISVKRNDVSISGSELSLSVGYIF